MRIIIKSFWPAIVWLVLSTVAFCLPGSVLPKEDWLKILQVDKWIHVGLFAVMVFLWCVPFLHRTVHWSLIKLFTGIALAFLSYGIVMELVQHFLVPHRSFDWGDVGADAAGCLAGLFFANGQRKL